MVLAAGIILRTGTTRTVLKATGISGRLAEVLHKDQHPPVNQSGETIRRFRLKRWHWIAFVLLLPFVAGIVGVKIRRHGLEKEIARELAAIRARGEPVTLEELDAWYPKVPDAENGALVLTQALARLPPRRHDEHYVTNDAEDVARLYERSETAKRLTEADAETVRILSERHDKTLSLLRNAVRLKSSRFPVHLTNGSNILLPHLAPLKTSSKLLALVAMHEARTGNHAKATDALDTALLISDSLKLEPTLISQLVRMACLNMACGALAPCLSQTEFSSDELQRLSATIGNQLNRPGHARALPGERVIGLDVFRYTQNWTVYWDSVQVLGEKPPWWNSSALGLRARFHYYKWSANDAADRLHLLKTFSSFSEVFALPENERPAAFEKKTSESYKAQANRGYLVSDVFIPTYRRTYISEMRTICMHRAASVALALERFRLDSGGSVPDSLDELVPKHLATVPADPFTGKPLRYLRHGRGYVVYSVGENLTDEQGAPKSDVPFIVEK